MRVMETWYYVPKSVDRVEEKFYSGSKSVFQDGGDLTPQFSDSRWLSDFALLTDLTAKRNEFDTELQGENKTVIKMTGAVDSSKGNLMKGALTQFPSVQSRASVYVLCIDKLLEEFGRRFKRI